MTCIYHYTVIQNSITVLKLMCIPSINLFIVSCPRLWQPLIFPLSLFFFFLFVFSPQNVTLFLPVNFEQQILHVICIHLHATDTCTNWQVPHIKGKKCLHFIFPIAIFLRVEYPIFWVNASILQNTSTSP